MIDIAIIGGGPAGLAAALYAKRYELDIAVFAKEPGGLLTTTHIVENYPGILPLSGPDMMDVFVEQVGQIGVEVQQSTVTKVERLEDGSFEVCVDGDCVKAKTVIFATGTKHRHLRVPGEEEFKNKGVSYCATCDGPLFRGHSVVIAGGGDSAAKEALLLSDYCEHVYIIARSMLKAEPINDSRVKLKDNVTVLEGTVITEILGDDSGVSKVKLSKEHDGSDELDVTGVFVAIGHLPQTELVMDLGLEMTARQEIMIDRSSRTNIKGFYAAGDVTDTPWKQAIISAAEGSQAANSAYEDITNNVVRPK